MYDLPVLRHGRLLLWLLAAIVIGATLTGFAESYNGLYHWALGHKVTHAWARAWPLQVDAFVAAGELSLILAARYLWALRMRILAWTISGIGLAVSILCNAGHVGQASWQVHATAAVPPIAAMGGLLAILATLKQITYMGRQAPTLTPSVALDRPGLALVDPATVSLPQPSRRLVPVTPAARAAYLSGATHDLIAAMGDLTREVASVERMTPALTPSRPRPLPGVALRPLALTPGATLTTVSLTPPPNPAVPALTPVPESVPSVVTESDSEAESADGGTTAEQDLPDHPEEVQREVDRLNLAVGNATDASKIRYAIDALGLDATPARIHNWLRDRGQGSVTIANVKSTLRRARAAQGAQKVNSESETPVNSINSGAK